MALFLAAPNAALADNECDPVGVDPSANLGLADSYDCGDASYASGVTYDAVGDLFIDFTNADSPVRSTIGTSAGGNGIDLNAAGTDSIFFDSATTATEIENLEGMEGAMLSVTTADGNIGIATEEMDGDFPRFSSVASGVTHGIFAQSTGAGDIGIVTTGSIDLERTFDSSNPDAIGIEAQSNGGDIDITTGGSVRAIQYGILAGTSGSGALTLTADGVVALPSNSDTVTESNEAAIDATSGTGLLTVNIGGDAFVQGGGGSSIDGGFGIRTDSDGDQVINIASGSPGGQVRTLRNTVMDLTAAGAMTVNNAGLIWNITSARGREPLTTKQITAIRAEGSSLTLNNDNSIQGVLDFTGLDDGYVFNNNAGAEWSVRASRVVSDGITELGAGTINNAGTIEFVARRSLGGTSATQTGTIDPGTVVSAPGTSFTGTGDSLLEMAVSLGGSGQGGCSSVTVADCLDLSGGETAGRTEIDVVGLFSSLVASQLDAPTTANAGIVLVDVSGGASAPDHFVLSQASGATQQETDGDFIQLYAEDPIYGAVLDMSRLDKGSGQGSGIFDYALLYNAGTQQHVLASVPQREAIEYVAHIDEATSLWHTVGETVAGRQADVRDGATGKLWVRAVRGQRERKAAPTFTSHGNSFQYEHGYSIDNDVLVFGSDMFAGDDHVVGLHVGLVRSRLDFDDSDTHDQSKGGVFGAYGGWWNEAGLSLDGAINANFVSLDHNVTGFENSNVNYIAFGARAEAGWRLPLMSEALYVQPLATAAYVNADIDQVELQDNELSFEDSQSLRAALGVRLGGESALNAGLIDRIGYWVTARAWEEQIEDGEVRFATGDGGHLAIADDRSGGFEEINLGVSVSNEDDTVSGYLSGAATSGDDVDTYNVSIGARLNW